MNPPEAEPRSEHDAAREADELSPHLPEGPALYPACPWCLKEGKTECEHPPLSSKPEELSLESKVMIQLYKEQNETLQSHMARQNMMIDVLILELRKANVALELLLPGGVNPNDASAHKMMYRGSCEQLVRVHNEKVARVKAEIDRIRSEREGRVAPD